MELFVQLNVFIELRVNVLQHLQHIWKVLSIYRKLIFRILGVNIDKYCEERENKAAK
jgi:hypothetical protein